MKYRIKLPIGDWSDDGHGKCTWYVVESSHPVHELREAHYKISSIIGMDMDEVCADYGNNVLPHKVVQKLQQLGYDFSQVDEYDLYMNDIEEYKADLYDDGLGIWRDDLVYIWIFLLQHIMSELSLKLVPDDQIPMLPFYGHDSKGRHIGHIGYGLH